jgi:PTH2 family peptidyl-tRNA hydrolase
MNTKQVLVVRKDLNMRKGKIAAQCSHAAMSFLTRKGLMMNTAPWDHFRCSIDNKYAEEVAHWLNNSFRKICVFVNSEEELDAIHQKALDNGLMSNMIIDNGATEFNGVLTKTVVAIGPHWDEKFEGITDKLPLL